MKKMTEFVRDAEKRKKVTFRIKCNVVCAKKICYYISKLQNSCKNAQKSREKSVQNKQKSKKHLTSSILVVIK